MKYMEKITDIQDIEKGIVILYFKSDYCYDCIKIGKHLDEIESTFKHIKFYSVDKKLNIELFKHYDIFGIPSFVMIKDGIQINRFVSKKSKTKQEVISWIRECI